MIQKPEKCGNKLLGYMIQKQLFNMLFVMCFFSQNFGLFSNILICFIGNTFWILNLSFIFEILWWIFLILEFYFEFLDVSIIMIWIVCKNLWLMKFILYRSQKNIGLQQNQFKVIAKAKMIFVLLGALAVLHSRMKL